MMSKLNNSADRIYGVVPALPEQQANSTEVLPLILQYWQLILRWRTVVAGVMIASLVVALVATLLTPPLYTARTEIEISREQKNFANVADMDTGQDSRDSEFYATQYALLVAESQATRVARKLGLATSGSFFQAHGVDPADLDGGEERPDVALARREDRAVALLLKHVGIEPIRNSRLVDIRYTSRSSTLSAQIANAWAEQFIDMTLDRQYASTSDARRFLEDRLAGLKEKLEQSERAAASYASEKDIVALDAARDASGRTFTQRTLVSADLEALNQALTAARAERIAAESGRLRANTAESSPEVLTNPAIVQMRAQRTALEAEYASLMVRFEPEYPAAKAIRQQIAALDAALARESGRVIGSRQLKYEEARARETELAARVSALKADLERQREASIQYNIYQREADTNRQLYDALLQRYKEVGIAGTVGASNIAVVDMAAVPKTPSSPNLFKNLMIAVLFGLILSAATVFGLEQIDEGVRGPEDVRKWLGIPILGNVPLIRHDPLTDLGDPKSHLSEAYFSIMSMLSFSTNRGLPRTLSISSTRESEGKSTTAKALAEIMGRTGKRVLLIDGDLRSPSLHRFLKVRNEAGLSNLLAGKDSFADLVQETGLRGLHLLTSGPLPPSPAELLSSRRLEEVLETLLADYDHIVIDAPPVLGLADSPLLGRAVEGVVFVIEAERTPKRAISYALSRLRGAGDHIFGAIVTKVDFSRHIYGYSYRYDYHDGAQSSAEGGRQDSEKATRPKRWPGLAR